MLSGGAAELTTVVEHDGPGPLVRVSGEMDLSNASTLEAVIDQLLDRGMTRVSFDLSGLGFIDSSGLAVLVRCAARVDHLVVLHPSVNVRRVIEVSGLAPLLLGGLVDESRSYTHDPQSVTEARHFAAAVLEDLTGDVVERVSLMVSELASNAVRHTEGGFAIRVRATPREVRVDITDHGAGSPVIRAPSLFEPAGRGLLIVESLSDGWGVVFDQGVGKTVWFRLDRAAGAVP